MSAPYPIQLAPADIWLAPIGEAFPSINDTPAANWVLRLPATSITEDGITIAPQVQDSRVFALGSVAPVKAGIVQRQFTLECNLMDMTVEAIALAMGGDPDDVTDTAAAGGEPGHRSIALPSSPVPQGWAALVRWGQSGYGDDFNSQYEIKSVVQVGGGGHRFHKADPLAPAFNLVALWTDANWVVFRSQDAAVSP